MGRQMWISQIMTNPPPPVDCRWLRKVRMYYFKYIYVYTTRVCILVDTAASEAWPAPHPLTPNKTTVCLPVLVAVIFISTNICKHTYSYCCSLTVASFHYLHKCYFAIDIALTEASKSSALVAVIWICRHQGKLIRGMDTATVSLLPEISGNPNIRKNLEYNDLNYLNNDKRAAVDYLSVGLNHSNKVKLSSPKINIPIIINVKSNNISKKIYFSINIINKKNDFLDIENAQNDHDVYEFQSGLTWGNKTTYLDIELLPYESKEIKFLAIFSKSGMFDLNRWVGSLVTTDTHMYWRNYVGIHIYINKYVNIHIYKNVLMHIPFQDILDQTDEVFHFLH